MEGFFSLARPARISPAASALPTGAGYHLPAITCVEVQHNKDHTNKLENLSQNGHSEPHKGKKYAQPSRGNCSAPACGPFILEKKKRQHLKSERLRREIRPCQRTPCGKCSTATSFFPSPQVHHHRVASPDSTVRKMSMASARSQGQSSELPCFPGRSITRGTNSGTRQGKVELQSQMSSGPSAFF